MSDLVRKDRSTPPPPPPQPTTHPLSTPDTVERQRVGRQRHNSVSDVIQQQLSSSDQENTLEGNQASPDNPPSKQKPRRAPPPPPEAGSPEHRKGIKESLASTLQLKREMERRQAQLAADQERVAKERDKLKALLDKQSKESQRRIAELKRQQNRSPQHRVADGAIEKVLMRSRGSESSSSPTASQRNSKQTLGSDGSAQGEQAKLLAQKESIMSKLEQVTSEENALDDSWKASVERLKDFRQVAVRDVGGGSPDESSSKTGGMDSTPEQAVLSLMLSPRSEEKASSFTSEYS